MQDKSEFHSEFSERTERLAAGIGILLSELPDKIGVSPSMFYGYRSGKNLISRKAWRKLEEAERDYGIKLSGGMVREDPVNYGLRAPDEPTIQERLANMERNSAAMRENIEAMKNALDALTDLFTNRPPREKP